MDADCARGVDEAEVEDGWASSAFELGADSCGGGGGGGGGSFGGGGWLGGGAGEADSRLADEPAGALWMSRSSVTIDDQLPSL